VSFGIDLMMSAGSAGSQVSWSMTTSGEAASIAARTSLASNASAVETSAEFAQTLHSGACARHANHLMAKCAEHAHEGQAHGARGACNEDLHTSFSKEGRALSPDRIDKARVRPNVA
jgi:hypothetical protein